MCELGHTRLSGLFYCSAFSWQNQNVGEEKNPNMVQREAVRREAARQEMAKEIAKKVQRRPLEQVIAGAGALAGVVFAITCLLPQGFLALPLLASGAFLIYYWPKLLKLPAVLPTQLIMSAMLLATVGAGIWGGLVHLVTAAGFSMFLAFGAGIFSQVNGARRLQQIFRSYGGLLPIIAAAFWLFTVQVKGGAQFSFLLLLISGVISLLYAYPTRSLPVLALLNGLLLGLAGAYLFSFPIEIGAAGGIGAALLFGATRRAFYLHLSAEERLSPLTFLIPFSFLGVLAFPLAGILY